MYTLEQVAENKYHLITPDGQPLKGWNSNLLQVAPVVMNKAVAERVLFNANNPVYDQPQPLRRQDVRGVVDNRHRNWRQRRG